MAKTQCLDTTALDLRDLSDLFNMATNQQSLSVSDDFLLSLLNGTDQPISTVDLSELDPSPPSPVSTLSSHPSSPSSSKTVPSPHSTTQTIPEMLDPLAGGVSDPLFSCLADMTSNKRVTPEMPVVTTSGLPLDLDYVVDIGTDTAWMSSGQDDVDLETLDEGMGDSVEETSVMVEGQETLLLTNEEKRLLVQEGVTLPEELPLTKNEEKALKRVRRKIKNKISAQESRKKKKVYVDGLEKRVEQCTKMNRSLQKKVQMLENQNKSLIQQLKQLQALVGGVKFPSSIQTGTCVMVLVLSFAVFFWPSWNPFSTKEASPVMYTSTTVKSRSLLHTDETSQRVATRTDAVDSHVGDAPGALAGRPPGDPQETETDSENSSEIRNTVTSDDKREGPLHHVTAFDGVRTEAGKDISFRLKDDDL